MATAFDFDPTTRRFGLEVDGVEKDMPALSGRALGLWRREYAGTYGRVTDDQAADAPKEGLVDALVAYDLTDALGGREWVEKHLTDEQLVSVLQQIVAVHR